MKSCVSQTVAILRNKLANSIGLPFVQLLPESFLEKILTEEKVSYRKRCFCPIITLWAWLSQVLDPDKSCKNALSRVMAHLVADNQAPPSTSTSAYCQARGRLSENLPPRLVRLTGSDLQRNQPSDWLWYNRDVFVVDGSSLLMADTEENQEVYRQHKSQKEGCGFPIARIVAVFSLFTGAVLDAAISGFNTGEINLFRRLYPNLRAGSVALGDRMFGTYADICLLSKRLVDSVFRLHGSRPADFRKGKRISRWDHIVMWTKPKQRPVGISKSVFDTLPQQLLLREVRFHIQVKGFRTEDVTLVTTLLDHNLYPLSALAELYGLRWQVELDIRHLKTTMGMEHLLSKTPQMVKKEFYIHLLAYNLIRQLQCEAGREYGILPITLSFKATIQHLSNFLFLLAMTTAQQRRQIYQQLITLIAHEKLMIRPNRIEPRVVKRRPKNYQRMNGSRKQLKQKCLSRKINPKTGKSSPSY